MILTFFFSITFLILSRPQNFPFLYALDKTLVQFEFHSNFIDRELGELPISIIPLANDSITGIGNSTLSVSASKPDARTQLYFLPATSRLLSNWNRNKQRIIS